MAWCMCLVEVLVLGEFFEKERKQCLVVADLKQHIADLLHLLRRLDRFAGL